MKFKFKLLLALLLCLLMVCAMSAAVSAADTKTVTQLRARYLPFPSYMGEPGYTIQLDTEGVEMYTGYDVFSNVKNGISWWYIQDGTDDISLDVGEDVFSYARNPVVMLYIRAKEGYKLDPEALKEDTIIFLGSSYVSTSRTSRVIGTAEVLSLSPEECLGIILEVPMEQTAVKATNAKLYSGVWPDPGWQGTSESLMVGSTIGVTPDHAPNGYYFSGWTLSPANVQYTRPNPEVYPNNISMTIRGNGSATMTQTATANYAPITYGISADGGSILNGSSRTVTSYLNHEMRYMLAIPKEQYDKGYRLEITGYSESYVWEDTGYSITDLTYAADFKRDGTLSVVDNKDGTIYLQDKTVSGVPGVTAENLILFRLVRPDGTYEWVNNEDGVIFHSFTVTFEDAEGCPAGVDAMMQNGTRLNFESSSAWSAEFPAYMRNTITFAWTTPTEFLNAESLVDLYVVAEIYVNDTLDRRETLEHSITSIKRNGGLLTLSPCTIDGYDPGTEVRIVYRIMRACFTPVNAAGDEMYVASPACETVYSLTYTTKYTEEQAYVFDGYSVNDGGRVSTSVVSYTEEVTVPAFVDVSMAIDTKYITPMEGYKFQVLANMGNYWQDITERCATVERQYEADGLQKSYSVMRWKLDDVIGAPGETKTIRMQLRLAPTGASNLPTRYLGTATLNLTFAYDNRWNGELIQRVEISPEPIYASGMCAEFDIYEDYTADWYWLKPSLNTERFVCEPHLETYREAEDKWTAFRAADLDIEYTDNTWFTAETIRGTQSDLDHLGESYFFVTIRDTATDKTYMVDTMQLRYSFTHAYTTEVLINGTEIGTGNSIEDQTVAERGAKTQQIGVTLDIPTGLATDGYYIGASYYVYAYGDTSEPISVNEFVFTQEGTVNRSITIPAVAGDKFYVDIEIFLADSDQEYLCFLEQHCFNLFVVDPSSIGVTVECVDKFPGTYTVSGQVVTVKHTAACAVGYLDGDKYVKIPAVANPDGTYSFTAPSGITTVVLVLKGDANGDGKITNADVTRIKAAYFGKITLSAAQAFAADANSDSKISNSDVTRVKAVYLGKTSMAW